MKDGHAIFIGWDSREVDGFVVTRRSIEQRLTWPIPARGIVLNDVRERGLYRRPTSEEIDRTTGHRRLIDELSRRPDYPGYMATEFALSRFLLPWLSRQRYALFCDCDMLCRGNIARLFEFIERDGGGKALWCVKHDHRPAGPTKMGGQAQTGYARKNWSSMFIMDLHHPANSRLTLDMVNSKPGLWLHQFSWLEDDEIGGLGVEWNWLVGSSPAIVAPQMIHFTEGLPSLPKYSACEYAEEWQAELRAFAA